MPTSPPPSSVPRSLQPMPSSCCSTAGWNGSGQADVGALAKGLAARANKLGVTLQRDAAALAKTFAETSLPRLRQLGAIA